MEELDVSGYYLHTPNETLYTVEFTAAMKRVNPKGSVKENRRRDGSYGYYLSEPIRAKDAKGVGPFLWASPETEMLGYTTGNLP